MTIVRKGTLAERLWAKVDRSAGPDACWPFTGKARVNAGHRQLSYKRRMYLAHRVAYEVAVGPIPDGLHVRHTCDNPPCCNQRHLLVGTHADNMRDMVERGRLTPKVGEAHANAKLTEAAVRDMRRRHAEGTTATALALEHGVSLSAVARVVNGETWRHVA